MPRKKSTSSPTSKPQSVSSAASTINTASLAVSDLRLRLEFLEQNHEKLLQQIEKKRRELTNLRDRMREIGIEVAHRSAPVLKQLLELDHKIHELFADIFNGRKLGKQSRKDIEGIYYSLQIAGLLSHKPIECDDEEIDDEDDEEWGDDWNPEDFFGSNYREKFRAFADEPTPINRDDSRSERLHQRQQIRQLFLKLADVFHPDKTLDDGDREYRTEVMKEINQAYATSDLAKLLAIEKQHQMGELIDRDNESDLVRRCAGMERDNDLLDRQLKDIKQELRETKQTPEGSLVAEYKKMTKSGIDPIGELVAETESQIEIIAEIHQFIVDFRERKITIKDFIKGPAVMQKMRQVSAEQILEDFFAQF